MGTRLYVGNLSYNSTEAELSDFFAEVGEVIEARIVTDRETGRSRGFGFVEMADEASAQASIEQLNGKSLDGRELRINEARPRPPRSERQDRW